MRSGRDLDEEHIPLMQRHARWAAPVVVALLTILVFLPALDNGFVAWDDDKNFLNNPDYRGLGPANLKWMWTTFHLGHYVPLSWMTLGLDYTVWGMRPRGYHLTNVLLHAANASLVFALARRLLRGSDGIMAAAFAALFFAIHPLRVESVAWVTERRDMLSLLFALASILTYLRSTDAKFVRWYWMSVLLFACGLLSKATVMTVPAVLLLLNVHPLARVVPGRWWSAEARRVYLELTPFAVMSAAIVVLSIVALEPPTQLGLAGKVAVSAYGLAFYLVKTLLPLNLSPLYEMPRPVSPFAGQFVVSYLATIAFCAAAWLLRRKYPGATLALLAFAVVSLPMLGVVQNGPQIAADRYTYHAAPAIALLLGGVFAHLYRARSRLVISAAAVILGTLALLTVAQTRVWRTSDSLWWHVLAVDPRSSIAHSAKASLLFAQGRIDEATALSERAVSLSPADAEAHNALGVALARQGRLAEAIGHYEQSAALKPLLDDVHNNWGVALAQLGDLAGAVQHYRTALALEPNNADAHVNWGNALVRMALPNEAIPHYSEALRIRPDHADAHHNWGVALARQGRLAESVVHFQAALDARPDHAEAREYLARATALLQQAPR